LQLDGAKIGETKHLPPMLSVNYHLPLGSFVPYVGVGVNRTIFYDEKLDSSLDSVLLLDDSIGLAGQIGLDWILGNNLVINANVRVVSIETDAVVGGALVGGGAAALGTVKINPLIYGLNIGYKF
jgi:outer membrane protein